MLSYKYRYYVTYPGLEEREVTFEEWCKAERAAGFNAPEGSAATSGFKGLNGMKGRVTFECSHE